MNNAIKYLYPLITNNDYSLVAEADGIVHIAYWNISFGSQPTLTELATAETAYQAEYDSQAYARLRKAEYDKLNQDELRYDDLVNSTTTWQDSINAIKVAIPKGGV